MFESHSSSWRGKAWVSGFLSVFCLSLSLFCATANAGDLTENSLIALTNESRKTENLPFLKENPQLSAAAQAKAEDMLKNDYFAHTSPKGVSPWHWIKKAGYHYRYAGENLAINFPSANAQHKAWMKSPTHRANILNDRYSEIGMAVVEGKIDGKSATVTVALYGAPLQAVAAKKAEPAIVPVPRREPQVEGTEAAAEQPVLVTEINSAPPVPIIEAAKPAEQLSWLDLSWMLAILIMEVVLISVPLAFLWQALAALKRMRQAIVEPFESAFEHRAIPAQAVHSRGGV